MNAGHVKALSPPIHLDGLGETARCYTGTMLGAPFGAAGAMWDQWWVLRTEAVKRGGRADVADVVKIRQLQSI